MQHTFRLTLVAGLFLLALVQVSAEITLGPDLPKLSNLTFGWATTSVDPSSDSISAFAPQTMVVPAMGYNAAVDVVAGNMTFGDLDVQANYQTALTKLGPGVFRLMRYGFDSNSAHIPGMPAAFGPAEFDTIGSSYEISYAQQACGNTSAGISLIPLDKTDIHVRMPGGPVVVKGTTDTDWGVRVGALTHVTKRVKVGANYSYQQDSSSVQVHPMLTGAPDWTTMRAFNITRCGTVGGTYVVDPKTKVYCAFQDLLWTSDQPTRRRAQQTWYGAERKLTSTLMVRANYLDGGTNLQGVAVTKYGAFIVSYTNGVIRNARQELGPGQALFFGVSGVWK